MTVLATRPDLPPKDAHRTTSNVLPKNPACLGVWSTENHDIAPRQGFTLTRQTNRSSCPPNRRAAAYDVKVKD